MTSKSDLALLEDLRDIAQFIIEHHHAAIDADFVKSVNSRLTRSAALHPGRLRSTDQRIGVQTRHGGPMPPALTDDTLQVIVDRATSDMDPCENALDLFIVLDKAQPFEDGNKRTAVIVANPLLLGADSGKILTIPVDEEDPSVADRFNDLLARAYIDDTHDGVKEMLRGQGLIELP